MTDPVAKYDNNSLIFKFKQLIPPTLTNRLSLALFSQ
jgi:hypothetical protein